MKTYTIYKGKHRSGLHFRLVKKTNLKFDFRFDESCWYKKGKHSGVNKLYGFSHGLHHRNSVRIGWQPDYDNKGYIKVYSYVYNHGKRSYSVIATVRNNQTVHSAISIENGVAWISVNGNQIGVSYTMPRCKVGYMLYPYVGGKDKAQQTMTIDIEENYG